MKKRPDKYDRAANEIADLAMMFDGKSESNAKRAYAVIVAKRLFGIEVSLDRVCFMLSLLLGLKIGKLLSQLF